MVEPHPVVVLAGGQARRMGGGDKALRLLGGRPLLTHVLARLDPSGQRRAAGHVALSANGDPARFAGFGLPVLPDTTGSGPLAGVWAGMEWAAATGWQTLLSVPSDCPFLPPNLAEHLGEGRSLITCATSNGQVHHATALWSVSLRAELATALEQGVQRVWAFAAGRVATVGFAPVLIGGRNVDPFTNLNTLADLSSAEALLAD